MIVQSFVLSLKMVFCLILFFAGFCMYQLVCEITKNENTACLAGVIYMTSPYFFTDIYIRHALGECLAFVFIPLVFLGLFRLFETGKKHDVLIFGAASLLLSHNITTMITAVFAVFYGILNIKKLKNRRVKKSLLVDIILIILMTSFYWIPFLQNKGASDYQVFEKNAMATKESFLSHTIEAKDLLLTQKDTIFVFEIGLPVVFMLIFSVMAFRRVENGKKEYVFFLVSGMISLWMVTKYFPWKWIPSCFYIVQFPWRMLVFSTFFFAIVASINMEVLIRKFNWKDVRNSYFDLPFVYIFQIS